ncbi:MAG: hypothetical protein PHQ42_04205 [Patescibacteria group bacterium]|nr:hypothetical protein [Patescibacteria group bacterium]
MKKQRVHVVAVVALLAIAIIGFLFLSHSQKPAIENADNSGVISQVPSAPDTIRAEKIKQFLGFLTEYQAQNEEILPGDQGEREILWYQTYLCFIQMECAYYSLNETEKCSIFATDQKLPKGIKISQGEPLTEVAGVPLTSGNPREDFESFLGNSYVEIDYMSAWSMFQDAEVCQRVTDEYYNELEVKGLKVVH